MSWSSSWISSNNKGNNTDGCLTRWLPVDTKNCKMLRDLCGIIGIHVDTFLSHTDEVMAQKLILLFVHYIAAPERKLKILALIGGLTISASTADYTIYAMFVKLTLPGY